MRVRFWGTRGSIAKPGPGTLRYGGNTSCVEVRSASGTLLVLDCGTGAHDLGQRLAAEGTPLRGHILISHTHWDHIQGMPFFAPLFVAGNEWDIYAPRGLAQDVKETLAGQMQYTYFPVSLEELPATVRYHELVESTFLIDGVQITARYLNHPALDLGYRIEVDGAALVYATDHEPHSRLLAAGEHGGGDGDARFPHREDRRHAEFLAGADLVVHDTQYTAGEYATKVGWGHSTLESVVDTAIASGVRSLALFHHDPMRDDDAVDAIVESGRARVAAAGSALELFAAREGQEIELVHAESERPAPQAEEAHQGPEADLSRPLLLCVADRSTVAPLIETLHSDGLRVSTAADGDGALHAARREPPILVLAERHLAGTDGLALCRAIRCETRPELKDIPVVLIDADEDAAEIALGFAAGVTDWLIRPFSAEYARTRIRAWLLRTDCRWVRARIPADEADRLSALRSLELLDTPREERFDRLTRLASRLLDVPIALISLVDSDRQWFKAAHGMEASMTPRERSFCAHAILEPDGLVVADAHLDARFADNPLVTGESHIRFYAGQPLRAPDGSAVGTLCVLDRRPRQLAEQDLAALRDLAALAQEELVRRPAG
jgi:ribonuclease BN (tRNA processing enzyme)/DNA-binding response OmpR family regulator